jgi:hypothetical protein
LSLESQKMTPSNAFANIRLAAGDTLDTEVQTLRVALGAAREEARKANKVRGILEAVLRDIHGTSPEHKSAIECAWTAVNRVDEA